MADIIDIKQANEIKKRAWDHVTNDIIHGGSNSMRDGDEIKKLRAENEYLKLKFKTLKKHVLDYNEISQKMVKFYVAGACFIGISCVAMGMMISQLLAL